MEDNKRKIRFNFPQNREEYLMKIIGYVFLGFVLTFIANKISINFAMIVLLIVLIVLVDKIYMFMTVDEIIIKEDYFYVLYKNSIKYKIPVDALGVKVTHDINGVKEISFYDFFRKKKIFSFKENEINKNSFVNMIQNFKNFSDGDIFNNGTYGEMIPLVSTELEIDNFNYTVKRSFYSSYEWMIIPMVIVIIVLTLLYIK